MLVVCGKIRSTLDSCCINATHDDCRHVACVVIICFACIFNTSTTLWHPIGYIGESVGRLQATVVFP